MLEEAVKGIEAVSVGAVSLVALAALYHINTRIENWYYHTYAMHKNTPYTQEYWKYAEKVKNRINLSEPIHVIFKDFIKLELTSFPTFTAWYRSIVKMSKIFH